MAQLPQEQREAFLLQMEGELSVDEIAAITNTSFETTKSRLRYANRSCANCSTSTHERRAPKPAAIRRRR